MAIIIGRPLGAEAGEGKRLDEVRQRLQVIAAVDAVGCIEPIPIFAY
jgi:hypothetical protein